MCGNIFPSNACFLLKQWTNEKPFTAINVDVHSPHDDVIKWKHFPRNRPFARGIHRSPVNSPHKDQRRGALVFSLICVWINDWVNNGEAGDLRRCRAHYDVIVMRYPWFVCEYIEPLSSGGATSPWLHTDLFHVGPFRDTEVNLVNLYTFRQVNFSSIFWYNRYIIINCHGHPALK